MGCSKLFDNWWRAQQEHMSPATTFDEHIVISIAKRRRFEPRALSALLKARELLALSLGLFLAKVREAADPVHNLMARVKELELLLAQAREEADILRARLERLEPGGAATICPIRDSASCCS